MKLRFSNEVQILFELLKIKIQKTSFLFYSQRNINQRIYNILKYLNDFYYGKINYNFTEWQYFKQLFRDLPTWYNDDDFPELSVLIFYINDLKKIKLKFVNKHYKFYKRKKEYITVPGYFIKK